MIDALIIDMIGWLHMTGMAPPRANDTWKRSDTYAVLSIRPDSSSLCRSTDSSTACVAADVTIE